ncbi:MAG: DUF4835 family protein [Candidatus Marinimicrobia bacterium]|nr:DUF4835 family protein [Candidatus Neomarinimicrobiota bacterium]
MKRILFSLFLTAILSAQTFVPNVSIEGQNLNAQEQRIIGELKYTIEQYIESNSFSNELYELEIPYRITIYITQITQSGSKLSLSANAFFSNEYDQRYIDNTWIFEFTEGEAFYREMLYHSLRDIIDYYGYLIMATEMDGIEDLGGNSLFDLASEIYSRGSTSSWSKGWKNRKEDLDKLTGDFRLRKARYLYNQAFWAIDDGNGTKAWYYLEDALEYLIESKRLDTQNKFLNFFIDKHYEDSKYFVTVYQDTSLLPLYRTLSPSNNDFFDELTLPFKEKVY